MPRTGYLHAFGRSVPLGALLLLFPLHALAAGEMTSTFLIGGARIDVAMDAGKLDVSLAEIRTAIRNGGAAMSHGAEAAGRPLTIFAGRTAGRSWE